MSKRFPEKLHHLELETTAVEKLKQQLELQFVFLGTLGDVLPGLRVALAMHDQGWQIHCSIPNDPGIIKTVNNFPRLEAVTTALPVDFIQMIKGISESFYDGKPWDLLPNMFQVLTVDQVAEILARFHTLLEDSSSERQTVVLGNGIAEGLLSALLVREQLPFVTLSPNVLADPDMGESSYLPLPNYLLVPLLRVALNSAFSRSALGKVTGEKGPLLPVPEKLGSVYTVPPFAKDNPRATRPTYQVDYTGFEVGQEPVDEAVMNWLQERLNEGQKVWLVSPGSLTPNLEQVFDEILAYPDPQTAFLMVGVNQQFARQLAAIGEPPQWLPTYGGGQVMIVDRYQPYHAVMPYLAASGGGVLSHHGSGVSAIAREYGVPVVRVPLFVDSAFFASLTERAMEQIASLRYKVPTIPLKEFSAEKLAQAISETERPDVREAHMMVAESLHLQRAVGELGVDAAVKAVTSILLRHYSE